VVTYLRGQSYATQRPGACCCLTQGKLAAYNVSDPSDAPPRARASRDRPRGENIHLAIGAIATHMSFSSNDECNLYMKGLTRNAAARFSDMGTNSACQSAAVTEWWGEGEGPFLTVCASLRGVFVLKVY
jgi:hypothetical protein